MVSNWMENGTINEFVKRNQNTDRINLVGCRIISVLQKLSVYPACRRGGRFNVYA